MCELCIFCLFKQKTAYELRISDWSSDVCSSDLIDETCRAHELTTAKAVETRVRAAAVSLRLWRLVCINQKESTMPALRDIPYPLARLATTRSEERRVGTECVSTCRSRWSP